MKQSLFKRGRVGVAIAYFIGAWMYGLIYAVSNSGEYTYIGSTGWSLVGRSLSWPYWVVIAII